MEADGVTVPAGANITVVAHLDEGGTPALTPFVNDTSPIAAGEARLTVRHTAAAPAVDVRANGEVAFADLANPDEATADLPAGTISADVVLAGTDTVAIGPADLSRRGRLHHRVRLGQRGGRQPGTRRADHLGHAPSPSGVPGGTGGQAAQAGTPAWLMLGSGALMAGLAAAWTLRRPSTREAEVRELG
ncbi:MAG: DUF4397 domain-containing protein [Nocardioides sp.]